MFAAGAIRYDHDVTDASHQTDRPQEPIGRGDAPSPEARLREVFQQIELLRGQPPSPKASAAGRKDESGSTARGTGDKGPRRSTHQAAREIDRLRAARVRPARDLSIASLINATHKRAADVQRRLGELIEIWEALVPEELSSHTRLTALRGSVLHVAVDSSPIAFELDRLLREGLDVALRQRYRRTLTRVKVTLAQMKSPHA